MKRPVVAASGCLLLAASLAWWMQLCLPAPVALTPALTGQPEYCLTCHGDLPEISPSHSLNEFGCVLCHGGERLALDADLAHSSMRGGKNPSDLAVVEESCGGENCHSGNPGEERDHIQRGMTSIQATFAGAIASARYSLGTQSDLTPKYGAIAVIDTTLPSRTGILKLDAYNPSDESHPLLREFGESCLNCHVSSQLDPQAPSYRFTGCSVCHTPLLDSSEEQVHRLTDAIPTTQCNTCHNRGSYDARTMRFVEYSGPAVPHFQSYYPEMPHFTRCEATLDCVDCHTRTEGMGCGDIHANKAEINITQCKTCHGTLLELPSSKTLSESDEVAFRLALLNPVVPLQPGDTILVNEEDDPLWNTRVLPDGTYELVGKISQQRYFFRPVMGSGCQQDPDQQEAHYCHECHAVER